MVCRTTRACWFLLCLAVLCLTQVPAAAATYYVSNFGLDTNDGLTEETAWATIDRGDRTNALSPGDRVVILEGTYDISAGTGLALANESGTAAAPITYEAVGEVVLDRGESGGTAVTIWASYLVIDGLVFKGGITTLKFMSSVGCELKNCSIPDKIADYPNTWGPALHIDGMSSGMKIHNNVIGPNLPWPSHGIAYDASGGNSKIYNNVIAGATDWAFVARYTVPGVEFKNNIIYGASNGVYSANSALAHTHNFQYGTTGSPYHGTTLGPGESTVTDPMFTDPYSGDFTLMLGSPAIDAGTYVGLPFNGMAPDIGAYETEGEPGQVGAVSGTVTDGGTGAVLADATVQLKIGADAVYQIYTNSGGEYSFTWPEGAYTLTASKAGYRPASSQVVVEVTEPKTVNFGLAAATPTTFYVSTSGDDANDGLTPGNAWATMDKGDRDNVLIPGDEVIVQAGTYSGRQVTLSNKSGTAGSPITYTADGEVVIDRADYNGTTWSLAVSSREYLVFDGFTFTGGVGGVRLSGCEKLEIKNCTVRDLQLPAGSGWYYPGIHSIETGSTYIHNNQFYGTLGHVIVQDFGGNGNRYYNNSIYAYTTCWAFICGWAKGFAGDHSRDTDVEFRNNICYTGGGHGILQYTPLTHTNNLFWPAGSTYGEDAKPGPGEMVQNPMYFDEWLPDLSLRAGSPAIDAGALVGLPFNGSWPDIGAFETAGTPNSGEMGTITGKVTDAVSGTAIAGALVAAGPNGNVSTTTDANGDYTLQVLLGTQQVFASKVLYATLTKTEEITSGTKTVDFELQPIPPETYYVSTTGSDSNNGSFEHPWATIDKGDRDNILNPGDTVIVLPGTYVLTGGGDAPPFAKRSGLPGRPITYTAQGEVILDRGNDGGTTLSVRGPSHIVIDGFQLINGRIPIATVNATDIEIKNCWIHGKNHPEGGWGLWIINGADHKVHNNVFGPDMLFPCHGIDINSPYGGHKIYNNVFVGTTDWAFVARGQAEGVEFKNNIIYDVTNGVYNENANLKRSHNMYFNVSGVMFGSGGLALGESIADPLFSDEEADDFTLAAGSPAIDAGTLVGLPFNDSWPDIGAFETDGIPGSIGGAISGRVTNSATGVGLIGAIVAAGANSNAYTTTDADGYYALELPSGLYDVTASAGGFASATQPVVVASEPQTVNLALDPNPVMTYYVSPTGSDDNDGETPETAWASIDKGDRDSIVSPGDTVLIQPGTYVLTAGGDGPTFINRSGTANRPITYMANGGRVDIDVVALPGGASRIYANYIVLDGLNFKGGIYGLYVGGSAGSEVMNCSWTDKEVFGWPTVYVSSGSRGLRFHHNLLVPKATNYCHGIQDDSSGGYHRFYNNTIVGVTDWSFACTVSTPGVEFRNNIIYGAGIGNIYGANLAHSHNLLSTAGAAYGGGASAGDDEWTGDPMFVDAGAGNYWLAEGSPAIDSGMDVGLAFLGSAPDRGAFEFGSAPVFETDKIGELLRESDGTSVKLLASVVTAESGVFAGNVIYVEDESRAAGIRVVAPASPTVAEGDRVSIEGTVATTAAGEREIRATTMTVISSGSPLGTLGTQGKSALGSGLSGLLVKVWGNVTYKAPDNSYFCVDDGSGLTDGQGHAGIPVVLSDLVSGIDPLPALEAYVAVTGVAGADNLGGGAVPAIRARAAADIESY